MKKLKIILLFSFIILIPLSFIYNSKSKYSNETEIKGIVNSYKIDGNELKIELLAKEKIIAYYYFKTEEEKNSFTINLGDEVLLEGNLKEPSNNTNFNLFNYKKYLLSKKIHYLFYIDKYEINSNTKIRYKIKNLINKQILKSKNSDYLLLFLLGDNNIDEEVKESYKTNGISHLFAISGLHITIFIFLLSFILNIFLKNKKINFLLISLFLLFYMFLTNFTPSVVRASLFFIMLQIKKIYNIPFSNKELFIILFLSFIVYNPFYIYNTGFLYSFSISFGLIFFGDNFKFKNYFKNLFFISCFSFLISYPITINNNFEVNLFSPLLNLIFVPYVSYIIFPLCILNFIFPFFDSILKIFLNILEQFSLFFSNIKILNIVMCRLPIFLIIIYIILIIFIFYKFSKKKLILLLIFFIIHFSIPYMNNNLIVNVLDVGQGDSILIEFPNHSNILIDTGGKVSYLESWQIKKKQYSIASSITIPYLKSKGIKKIDYLILSHGDYDHMGEAINLVNNFKVDNVIFNNGSFNDLENELIKVLEDKNIKYYNNLNELNIKNIELQFLNTKTYDNENDNSNVIYFNYNDYKFLFMGDAGIEKEKDILDKYNLKDIDFLKVGHHGSNTSSSEYFIQNINPKYSLISVGINNRYGHPKDSVLKTLSNSKIYRTDLNGSIEIKVNKKGYKIKTCIS